MANAWRATPAATAARWSRGLWVRQPHLQLISRTVAAIAERPLRLIVSMPPRHGKSELLSHWTPVWFLANWPHKRVGLASYSAEFAATWGRKARDSVVRNQGQMGVTVRDDLNRASQWELSRGGGMMTAGVGGPFTGYGFDLLIIDDPIKNRQEANSAVYREHLWEWWRSTARTRLEPDGSIIIVMTRWHEDDLVGRLLAGSGEKWEHIRLPALAEEMDPLGRREGDPLWPERYGLDALGIVREAIGSSDWAGLYQQRPAPREGGMFKTEWWEIVAAAPSGGQSVRGWDLAGTSDGGDYTAGCKMRLAGGAYYIEDMVRFRGSPGEVERMIRNTASMDGPETLIDLPQDPGQAGKAQVRYLVRQLAGYNVRYSPESGSKELRAGPLSAQAEVGNVKLVRGPWNRAWIDEASVFPNGTYDDQIDAASRAFHRLANRRRPVPIAAPILVEMRD